MKLHVFVTTTLDEGIRASFTLR